jgi:hypothetical protein
LPRQNCITQDRFRNDWLHHQVHRETSAKVLLRAVAGSYPVEFSAIPKPRESGDRLEAIVLVHRMTANEFAGIVVKQPDARLPSLVDLVYPFLLSA